MVYAKRTTIEFSPTSNDGNTGTAVALEPRNDGWQPTLNVSDRRRSWSRGGRRGTTLLGSDDEGFEFVWYIAGAADRYLTRRQAPTKTPDLAATDFAVSLDEIDEWREILRGTSWVQSVVASPLNVLDRTGLSLFYGDTVISVEALAEGRALSYARREY